MDFGTPFVVRYVVGDDVEHAFAAYCHDDFLSNKLMQMY